MVAASKLSRDAALALALGEVVMVFLGALLPSEVNVSALRIDKPECVDGVQPHEKRGPGADEY